jgi:hypothetical protein
LGSYINVDNMEESLRMGHMPPGTIWYMGIRKLYYIVRGDELEEQHLEIVRR